jgi:hypothetical protein
MFGVSSMVAFHGPFFKKFDGIMQPVLGNPKFAVTRNPLGSSFLWQS